MSDKEKLPDGVERMKPGEGATTQDTGPGGPAPPPPPPPQNDEPIGP